MVRDIVESLTGQNPEVGATVQAKYDHQRRNIKLIVLENLISPAVLSAAATVLTDKCTEGHPSERYYSGCQCVDVVEDIARKWARRLFGTGHASVQPHCDASTNYAVYTILHEHGDTMFGMDLTNGGHLTHGSPVNFLGKNYNIVAYGVNDQGYIDYDQVCDLTKKHRPCILLAGVPVYPRTVDFKTFADIAHEVGAYLLVDMAHITGLVAIGLHSSPVPYADVVTTTTHKTLRGPRGDIILYKEALAKKIGFAIFPGNQGGLLERIIATKAVALEKAMRPEFEAYREQILKNAAVLAKALMTEGFDLVGGGIDNHLILVNPRPARFTGKEMERRLDEVDITVNKNAIPSGPEKPFITSGTRVDTPAAIARGFREADTEATASIIWHTTTDFEGKQDGLRIQVAQPTGKYPLYEQTKWSTPVQRRRPVGK